jgi:teichuronic acid biosynthesis glycosyltransferase TuaG
MNYIDIDIDNELILQNNIIENIPTEGIGISILIPFKNGIEFLEEAIISVVKQTYTNWELDIGINGLPQDSDVITEVYNIVNKFINHKHKINIKHYDIKGAALTLNALATEAKYDWVAFLDADDYWEETKLEKQVKYIKDYDVIGTHCRYFGNLNFCPTIPLNDISGHNIFHINPLLHSSILIKKELVEFEDHFIYDYNLWFKLYRMKKKFFNVPDILMYHRVHQQSAYNNTNQNYLNELKSKWKAIYRKKH